MTPANAMAVVDIAAGIICIIVYLPSLRKWPHLLRWQQRAVLSVLLLCTWGVGGYAWVTFVDPSTNITLLRLLFAFWALVAAVVHDSIITVKETRETSGAEGDLADCKEELAEINLKLARVEQYWEMAGTATRHLNNYLDIKDKEVADLGLKVKALEVQVKEMERGKRLDDA